MLPIKTDSRKIVPGDTFVALRGISSDGHSYIEKAIEKGATKIIAEEGSYDVSTTIVPDTRKYLEEWLNKHYQEQLGKMTLIGITGTNGKTTSAYLLYQAFNKLGKKASYIGTLGFYKEKKIYDLPNTSPEISDIYEMLIDSYESGCQYVVMEVSSQGLSYGRLNGILFDYAIFTNLTQDHLDFHKTMENYAKAKQQLFYQVKKSGKSFVNIDDEYHSYFEIGNVVTYGFQKSDYQIKGSKMNEFGNTFTVNGLHIRTSLIGKYNIYNALCAVMILDSIGISKEKIEEIMPLLTPPPGRMEILKWKENTIIIDYAHTPDAMENVFRTIQEIPHRKTYVVFGCTGSRDSKKRPIMMQLALTNADFVIVTSDDLHDEDFHHIVLDMLEGNQKSHYHVEQNRYEATKMALEMLKEKDILLVLGKGHEEYILVGKEKIPYNDRKAIEGLLNGMKKETIES